MANAYDFCNGLAWCATYSFFYTLSKPCSMERKFIIAMLSLVMFSWLKEMNGDPTKTSVGEIVLALLLTAWLIVSWRKRVLT